MITHDCIDNYIFIVDQNICYSNTALSSFSEHYSEEEVKGFDDHKVIIKEEEGYQSFGREAVIQVEFFPEDQQISDISFKDPVATFIESYISENMKTSDLLNLSVFLDDFGFVNDFLSLMLHFKHQILISEDDEIISVLKLLGWMLWKFVFT
jgi:hypothetical protein